MIKKSAIIYKRKSVFKHFGKINDVKNLEPDSKLIKKKIEELNTKTIKKYKSLINLNFKIFLISKYQISTLKEFRNFFCGLELSAAIRPPLIIAVGLKLNLYFLLK